MSKRILVDMDQVLVDLHPYILNKLNQQFGTNYTEEDLTSFNYYQNMPDELADFIYTIWHEADLYNEADPITGALEGVEELSQHYNVVVVSSPMAGHASSKFQWLLDHGFDRGQIVFASDKSLVRGDVLIDDRLKNVKNFPNRSILFSRPWNVREFWEHRADSWNEVIDLTHRLMFSKAVPHA